MLRARAAIVLGLLAAAGGGCQTFIGVEDVEAHLPRLDGTYLLAIHRTRTQGAATEDTIRARCMASLDPETRTLDLDFDILGFMSEIAVGEGSITGIEFPADATSTTFAFNMVVPASAVAAPEPTGADQTIDVAEMILRAEAEYSFCARPAGTVAGNPTFGTLLLVPGKTLTMASDFDCDEREGM